jgi:predicted nucleotidyltransferase
MTVTADFNFVKDYSSIFGVILFGSYAYGEPTVRSDIDVCIVTRTASTYNDYSIIWDNLIPSFPNYDIRFFDEFPIQIQMDIIQKGIVLYSPDVSALYEYFVPIRRRWNDIKHRFFPYIQ